LFDDYEFSHNSSKPIKNNARTLIHIIKYIKKRPSYFAINLFKNTNKYKLQSWRYLSDDNLDQLIKKIQVIYSSNFNNGYFSIMNPRFYLFLLSNHPLYDKQNYDKQNYDKQNYNKQNYNKQNYNQQNYNKQNYNKQNYNEQNYNNQDFIHKKFYSTIEYTFNAVKHLTKLHNNYIKICSEDLGCSIIFKQPKQLGRNFKFTKRKLFDTLKNCDVKEICNDFYQEISNPVVNRPNTLTLTDEPKINDHCSNKNTIFSWFIILLLAGLLKIYMES
jgi:hypothetical protein